MCDKCRAAEASVERMRARPSAMSPGNLQEWRAHDSLKSAIRSAEDELVRLRTYEHKESWAPPSRRKQKEDPQQLALF